MSTAHSDAVRAATFLDDELQAELDERGFVVIDLLGPEQIAALAEVADRVYVDDRHGFHASNLSGAHEYRHAVYREVRPILEPALAGLLDDHEPFTASLLMKWPGEDSAFHTHQDWTMVEEDRFRTVNVWCPLVDSTVRNGALRVLPGSHRVLDAIRCSPMPPEGYESVGWQVGWEEMDPVEVAAGQALVFDHGLLHSSGPNLTDRCRPAVAMAFKPRAAELFHWYLPDPSVPELEVYAIGSDFFADIDIGERPDAEVVGRRDFHGTPLTKRELLVRCGRDVVDDDDAGGHRALVRDPGLQRQLDEQGWAVVQLLDASEVERLLASHRELDHEITLDRSFAAGFHATVMDGRPDYRRAAHDAIADVVAAPFERIFVDMTLTLTNWLYKAPGAAAVPLHVDWTFVDEDLHRSISVWVPLVDTDEASGCIGVVSGSHHQVDFIRAAAHPSYHETEQFGALLPGHRTLPLRAGEAVLFDHRLVHFSTEHTGEAARLAITCELVPSEAEVLHFEQVGPDRFVRHHVEPSFFAAYASGDDPRTVRGHVDSAEVDGRSFPGAWPSDPPATSGPDALPEDGPVASRPPLRTMLPRGLRRRVRQVLGG